jgi:hypothetical protein
VTVPRLLRLIAIVIAVAGLADPALTREMSVPQPVTIAVLDASGSAAAERLRSHLDGDYDVTIEVHAAGSAASACPATGGCIVVSSGRAPERITSGAQVVGGLRVDANHEGGNLAVVRLRSARRVSFNGNALLDVQLHAFGMRGRSTIEVFDGDVLVGDATYDWPASPEASPVVADVVVEWAPIAVGLRRLRVRVTTSDTERTLEDNTADVGVDVRSEPVAILMYEPEATWLGTFVRRALQADARFRIDARTRLGPGLTVSRASGGPLTRAALEETGTVIVTAPGSLSAAEVELLERFVRVRGGSAVILLDRAPAGPVTRLLPPVVGEWRETEAGNVGHLRASELLAFDGSAPGVIVIESAGDRHIVISRAMTRGRVIASGAMDAWRYRGAGFSPFWSALVADAASAAGDRLEVGLDQTIVTPGATTGLTVEWRSIDEMPAAITARAEVRCGEDPPAPVRLWPSGQPGRFHGAVSSERAGACEVHAAITGPTPLAASAALLVTSDVRSTTPATAALDGAVAAHGGIVVEADGEAALVERVHELLAPRRAPQTTWPMRSPWWLVPFAACLGGEWWLRRRRGLR